jgi:integrase
MHLALKVFFNWAIGKALLEKNPMATLKPPGSFKTRDRVLSVEELKKVWDASKQLNEFGIIIQLCILTGQRRGELSQLTSKDYGTGLLSFAGHMTKNKRPHSIPLTPNSEKLLLSYSKPCSAWSKPKTRLDELSGVTDWTIHDLRRTFATIQASIGTAPHVVERLLNHTTGTISGVAAIYNRHAYLDEMREALQRYESHLASLGFQF